MFKLLVLDIDGVMTDGTKYYDSTGTAIMKQFCDRDFTAIGRFKENGIAVCFLSADKKINEAMAQDRGIDFFYSRKPDNTINKLDFLPVFKTVYGTDPEDIAYVGDDFFDVEIAQVVGHPYCVRNAPRVLQKVATSLNSLGGDGVVAELFDLVFEDD